MKNRWKIIFHRNFFNYKLSEDEIGKYEYLRVDYLSKRIPFSLSHTTRTQLWPLISMWILNQLGEE